MIGNCLTKRISSPAKNIILVTSLRTKIHPTPAKFEFIQGTSAVGKPAAYESVRIHIEKGKSYAWCSCGLSKKGAFCDGSHKKLNAELKEGETKFAPLRFVCEESRSVSFCMCKSSSNRPFCDGTHEQIKRRDSDNSVLSK